MSKQKNAFFYCFFYFDKFSREQSEEFVINRLY